jgi:catalase
LIPEELVPVQRIGKMTLDRNPDNFFAETEQVAFHPGHLVPGIDFSNDPLLQGRLFSYIDTQLSRLGSANFNELPINRPIVPVHNNQRDGHMRHTINKGRVNYEPNTLGGGCPYQAMMKEGGFASFPEPVEGVKVRGKSAKFHDHYSQATLFYRSQSVPEQNHLVNALRFELGKLEVSAVRERMIGQLAYVDADLAERVAEAFGIAVPDVEQPLNHSIPADTDPESVQPYDEDVLLKRSSALSMKDTIKDSIKTRRIAILTTDDGAAEAAQLKKALEAEGAMPKIIAPAHRPLGEGRQALAVDHALMTTASVLFDAVAVVGGKNTWSKLPDAKDFVSDAFRHCKAIALVGDAAELLPAWGLVPTDAKDVPGVVQGRTTKAISSAFIEAIAAHRHWDREADPLTGEKA